MSRRADTCDTLHTFGHNLLSLEYVQKLADQASHWAVILKFDNEEEIPLHNLFPKDGLISLFMQGRLCRHTLLVGFRTTRAPKRPVPACFFRTLDFLLQYMAAGNSYRAITDKEEAKGFPPAAWCRPPVVTAREDADVMTAAALAGASAEALERTPSTDPLRLFYSSRSWCCTFQYHMTATSVRCTVGVPPSDLYNMYCEGTLSEYLPVMGLVEEAASPNTYVPPSVMVPLGALLYMHEHGRPYLPLTLNELREVRSFGVMSIAIRPNARPLRLPIGMHAGVDPAALAVAAAMEPSSVVTALHVSGGGGGSASSSNVAGSRSVTRTDTSSDMHSPSALASTSGTGIRRQTGGSAAAEVDRGTKAGGSAATAATQEAEPDPVLDDSSRWIMPQPFDVPIPVQLSESIEVPLAADDSVAPPAVAATSTLPSSPFLIFNSGVQSCYETPPLRLFLGMHGEMGLAANWWYVDPDSKEIKGPFSPEAMLLSSITPCREINDETLLCGTEVDVRLPMMPPLAAFLPLGTLIHDIIDGVYTPVSRLEIVSPLARSSIGNRIRQPQRVQPQPLGPFSVTAKPVVVAMQAQQRNIPQPPVTAPESGTTAAAAAVVTSAVPAVSHSATPLGPVTIQAVPVSPRMTAQHHHSPQVALPKPPPPPPQQQQEMPLAYTAPASAGVPGAVRGLPLPLPHLLISRPRPVVVPPVVGTAVPAYTIPGSVVYMPQYGQSSSSYGAQSGCIQPMLGNTAIQQSGSTQSQQQEQQLTQL